jgi:hypothetical protein
VAYFGQYRFLGGVFVVNWLVKQCKHPIRAAG